MMNRLFLNFQQLKGFCLRLSGSGKADCVRAVDVLTVLREKVAFVSGKTHSLLQFLAQFGPDVTRFNQLCSPGGRDKRGGPILTFPARTNHDRIKQEDLSRLVTYLSTIPR